VEHVWIIRRSTPERRGPRGACMTRRSSVRFSVAAGPGDVARSRHRTRARTRLFGGRGGGRPCARRARFSRAAYLGSGSRLWTARCRLCGRLQWNRGVRCRQSTAEAGSRSIQRLFRAATWDEGFLNEPRDGYIHWEGRQELSHELRSGVRGHRRNLNFTGVGACRLGPGVITRCLRVVCPYRDCHIGWSTVGVGQESGPPARRWCSNAKIEAAIESLVITNTTRVRVSSPPIHLLLEAELR
jgi:hypothetical protein